LMTTLPGPILIDHNFLPILNTRKDELYWIGVDIGGNNARVGLLFATDTIEQYVPLVKFQATAATVLKSGLNELSGHLRTIMKNSPIGSSLAIAGPILVRTRADITNYIPTDRLITVEELDAFAFPPDRTVFINDLEGTCGGILALNDANALGDYYQPLWNPTNELPSLPIEKTSLVLAMGTGLGTAMIVTDFFRKTHHIIPMEAGHIFITELGTSAEHYSRESEMIRYISNKLYGNQHTIEFEDICSGRGIGYVYEFLTGESKRAGEIADLANSGNENAKLSITYVYRYLIRNAQNLSIFSQAKNIFLSGDNQVHNMPIVMNIKDQLHAEFLNHIKQGWLTDVNVWTQSVEANLNLFGTFYLAKRCFQHIHNV